MSENVCFVDTETTGLDPDRHQIWEVGLILPDGKEHHWFLDVDESTADPFALNIGRYWERHPRNTWNGETENPADFVDLFVDLTADLHLAGAVVSFDDERLRKLVHDYRRLHRWHYHLIDVETLAVGALAGRGQFMAPPWNSSDLSLAVGVDPEQFDRHTAVGDARWAKAIYDAVMVRP